MDSPDSVMNLAFFVGENVDSDLCSLIQAKLIDGGFQTLFRLQSIAASFYQSLLFCARGINHFLILQVDEYSVNSDSSKSESRNPKRSLLIAPLCFCIGLTFMNFYALWQMNVTGYFWRYALLSPPSLMGLAYFFSQFVQSTV